MRRALELAALGQGSTPPNPMVGAVVVCDGRVIGEGYHHRAGEPHAEVMAIASVREPELLGRSTLYVSLEPCSHVGKTPPCADLIVRSGIPRVVVAMQDPYPEVSGRGIERLRTAGIEVEEGMLRDEALWLNRGFVMMHTEGRPYISLKWAQSADGYIDRHRTCHTEPAMLFSSPLRLREVHRERMLHDAILIGCRTLLLDNPSLTNRYWYGRNPIRIVLAPRLGLPEGHRLLTDAVAPTWIVCSHEVWEEEKPQDMGHIRFLPISFADGWVDDLMHLLHRQGVQSLLVEGGASTLQSFVDSGLYDEVVVEVAPLYLGNGVQAPHLPIPLPL